MTSSNLGGMIRGQAREAVKPSVREGRVSKVLGGSELEVAVRSLMGDAKTLRVRGYWPGVREGAGGLELVDAKRGDRVWVAEDEGGVLVVVTWEVV